MSLANKLLPSIRNEFPRADTDGSGRKRAFFDAGAGSLVLRRAAEAEADSMLNYSANVGAPSWESQKVEQIIREGRVSIRDLLNAPSEDCIVCGESATSLFFRLTYALGKELKKDENVVTTEYDHYANVSSILELERRGTVKEARLARFDPATGMLDLDHLSSLIDSKTRIVSVGGVSNGLGSRTDLERVRRLARDVGAYFVIDAVHMVPHMPVDVQQLDCDFLIFSGYKVFSRRGSFMYGKKDLLQELSPYKVDPNPDKAPGRWEWGTVDHSQFAAFSAVVDYLSWLGDQIGAEVKNGLGNLAGRQRDLRAAMLWIEEYERSLSRAMINGVDGAPGILDIPRVTLYGPKKPEQRTPTFIFNLVGSDYRETSKYLWERHAVATLPDDFYSRALQTYGIEKAIRASLAHYNTVDEVRTFLNGLSDASKHLAE
ncbi:MAG: aminotransferase class V-fold PLP-dependent enzyme [Thaumarchaeota archaeon]|nr:aminotransferase class V-fold PLP-dependent enzyme [Nitrososphaerota archaeon]